MLPFLRHIITVAIGAAVLMVMFDKVILVEEQPIALKGLAWMAVLLAGELCSPRNWPFDRSD